jgi:hypothetical protein
MEKSDELCRLQILLVGKNHGGLEGGRHLILKYLHA